uniref:Uncharacterized protein n=1 Tax=Dulem virus 42 TaxID=3145760 RepID=A0AAU8B9V8_9CAUD
MLILDIVMMPVHIDNRYFRTRLVSLVILLQQ